jgi:hypothetical protein
MRAKFSKALDKKTVKDGQKRLREGDVTITGKIVRFTNSTGTETKESHDSAGNIEFIPIKLDRIKTIPNVIRVINGRIDVYCKVTSTEKAKEYMRYWAPFARNGHYKGEFKKILDFVDEHNNPLDHVWFMLANEAGCTFLISLKPWANAHIPQNLVEGSEVDISGTFGCYLDVKENTNSYGKKVKVDEVAAKELALNITHIPEVNEGDQQEDEQEKPTIDMNKNTGKIPKVSPYIRFNMTTGTGLFFSKDNTECSALQSFSAEVDDRRHFLQMPNDVSEAFGFIIPMSEYQADLEKPEDCEPGPSTGRAQRISFEPNDFEKPPKGVGADVTDTRESKKTIIICVSQYGEKMTDDDLPYQMEFTVYQGDVIKTGITYREHWKKFGRIPWHGIAIVTVDTKTTLNLAVNKEHHPSVKGKMDCWLKNIYFDVPSTCRTYGIKVDKHILLPKLYADVFVDAKSSSDERMLFIQMNKLGIRSENGFSNNPLHRKGVDSEAINLGEWTSDAGFILTDDSIELYILPYIPIKQDLLINGEVNEDEARKYVEDSTEILRNIKDNETFVKVILGEENVENLDLYHPEEIELFKSLKPPQRALVLPGRGPRTIRKYPKKPAPKTFGFDFLVYAIRQPKESKIREPEKISKKKSKTNKKN